MVFINAISLGHKSVSKSVTKISNVLGLAIEREIQSKSLCGRVSITKINYAEGG